MLERILVPLDGSMLAESVLVQVRQLLLRKDAEVLLLRVVTLPPSSEEDAGKPLDLLWSQATEYLRSVEGRLLSQGARVRSRVVEGFPDKAILETAKKENASLIALSTHGRTGIPRWVFGSVTEKVLRASSVPVLAVPSFTGIGGDAFPREGRELAFKKILLPIAADDGSVAAATPVLELARLFDAEVVLVHVSDEAQAVLQVPQMLRVRDLLEKGGVVAGALMKTGDPAAQILDTCRDAEADLIAMATHGHSGVSRWVLGSVAENVLRAATVPLLLVRAGKGSLGPTEPVGEALDYHSDP